MSMRIPLFPLNTVLFPGGTLTLRIFEPRYLRMVSDCLANQRPFGVCLIRSGREVGSIAEPFGIGTLAHIVDWEQRQDGLLGITARGDRRFSIGQTEADAQQLLHADVTLLEPDAATPLAPEFRPLAELLQRIHDQLGSTGLAKPEPMREMGKRATRMLLEFIANPDREIERLELTEREHLIADRVKRGTWDGCVLSYRPQGS